MKEEEAHIENDSAFSVYIRVRPLNAAERSAGATTLRTEDNQIFVRDPGPFGDYTGVKQYAFDKIFGDKDCNRTVFDATVPAHAKLAQISPLLQPLLSGINVTCFAYGMTGAGKTHTMFGDIYHSATGELGICTMAIDAIFERLALLSNARYRLRTSYLEIYNEQVNDLLVSQKVTRASTLGLMIVEDPVTGVAVPDLSEHEVKNSKELLELVLRGNEARTMAATKANQFSSRSHAILQIVVEVRKMEAGGRERVVVSKLSLVDLAGSERASTTENRGIRMLEGGKINRSLLALGNCINILSDKAKTGASFVPYRDSKLTRLLKDSLGGNTKTVMIACVSQALACYDETVNTLKYAERAKRIEKKLNRNVKEVEVVNADQYKEIIAQLQGEIESLRSQLSALKSAATVPAVADTACVSAAAQTSVMVFSSSSPVPATAPIKPAGDVDGPSNKTELETIEAEIAKIKESREKFKEELVKCREGNIQDLEFCNSVIKEDDGYLNKLSCDLLTKYEEHYEMKESIQELQDLNEKNDKMLEGCNRELDELVKRKTEKPAPTGIESAIERKLCEIEALKKSTENNAILQHELERSLEENSQMQQRYLGLVIKLQSHKKKEILELQIASRELRLEKLDLALQKLEVQRQEKLAERQRSQGSQDLDKAMAEFETMREELRQKDMQLQSSRSQIAKQNKELEQLRKLKDMYSDAAKKSAFGEFVSPSKAEERAAPTQAKVQTVPTEEAEENLDDVAGLIGEDCLGTQTADLDNRFLAGRGAEDPSFASVSTVNYNFHESNNTSAIDSINLCVNAMNSGKNVLGSPLPLQSQPEDPILPDKLPLAELRNCSPFTIPEETLEADQTAKHSRRVSNVAPAVEVADQEDGSKTGHDKSKKSAAGVQRAAETSRGRDKGRTASSHHAGVAGKENVRHVPQHSSKQTEVFLVSELGEVKRRNSSMKARRETGYFSSLSEHYGKAMNSLQVRHSVSTQKLLENSGSSVINKLPTGEQALSARRMGSFTARSSVQPVACGRDMDHIKLLLKGDLGTRRVGLRTKDRNGATARMNRLNTTSGKTPSCLQSSGSYEAPTLLSLPTEKSLVNLNKEISELIQRQKESLRVDFEKAKESVLQRAVGTRNFAPASSVGSAAACSGSTVHSLGFSAFIY